MSIVIQDLKLADYLFADTRSGRKTVTVRNGARDIVPGRLVFESADGNEKPIVVRVTRVVVTSLSDLPQWALEGEGLETHAQLFDALVSFYPNITLDSPVTAIEFEGAYTPPDRRTL